VSVQVTTSMVEQYRSNVEFLVQQKGSVLRSTVGMETVTGKTAFFEQIGATAARRRTSRHADTPRMDTPHSRRRVALSDYDWADLIDQEDKVRTLIEMSSPYATAAMWAMGRAMDDEIIAAADGTAYTGESGSTSTAYDTAMDVAITERAAGVSSSDLGLNVAKLITAKQLLDANEVDPDEPRTIVVNARQLKSLMNDDRATSADYAAVKALVRGEIDTFMGFKFVRTERIGLSGSNDKVLYFAKSGLKLGVGRDMTTRIAERPDKNHATQVFVAMSIGATRMQETKVGRILCHPTNGPGA
jgi:hypothetical protein